MGFKQSLSSFGEKLPFIPRLREIDEAEQAAIYAQANNLQTQKDFTNDNEKSSTDLEVTKQISSSEASFHEDSIQWQVRDEANRSWFKAIFDEYEYKPANIKRQRFWAWFNKNDTSAERVLISKLDIIITFYAFTMYWVKYLDQTNINNAYVSGMKTELNMKGNDLVNTQIVYTVGSIVCQIPFMYLIHRFPTHLILPAMDIGWAMFTLAIFRANSVAELQVYRFFVGVFESAFYPSINFVFGSWYKPNEYSRRAGFYYFGQFLGVLTSGLLQSATYQHLNGVGGHSGWRWLFIIDAIITIPIGIIGFFLLPGTPKNCYSLFLTDQEIYLARKRMRDANIALESKGTSFFDLKLWKKILTNWRYGAFVVFSIFMWNASNASSGAYILWLNSLKEYSVPLVNQYSTISPALGIFYIVISAFIGDNLRTRFGSLLFTQMLNLLGNVLLAVWHLPKGALWFAFCLQYFSWSSVCVVYSWASDATRDDPQIRAIITISMNMLGQSSTALTSAFVWKTIEAPRYLKGFSFTSAATVCYMITAFIVLLFYKRDERKNAHKNGILIYNSKNGELPPEIPSKSVIEVNHENETQKIE